MCCSLLGMAPFLTYAVGVGVALLGAIAKLVDEVVVLKENHQED